MSKYSVRLTDPDGKIEKTIVIQAKSPEQAYRRMTEGGFKVLKVTAAPDKPLGIQPAAPVTREAPVDPLEGERMRRLEQAARENQWAVVVSWLPLIACIGVTGHGLLGWLGSRDQQDLIEVVLGVIGSIVSSLWKWRWQDNEPWR